MNSACSRLFPGKKCVLSSSSYCSVVVPGWNRFFDSFLSVVIINCWQISQRIAEISKFWWVWAVWHVLGWGGHVVRMRGRGHVAHTCLVRRTGEPECRRWQWPAWLVNIHRGRSRELNWFRTRWGIIVCFVTRRSVTRVTWGSITRAASCWQWRAGTTRVWSVATPASFT